MLIFLLVEIINADAQRQTDNWYFGNNAGLSFRTGSAVPLYDGALQNWEGCASISDELGNLLFYTNGVTVWNAVHDTMQNGNGLKGDYSSAQSALIVPQPNHPEKYYIFTTDDIVNINGEVYTDGLKYSIVDMNEDNGLGKIIQKNITLRDSVSEKLTAVFHANGRDVWIISHEWNTDKFYTWLLTPDGIETYPVISAVGTPHEHIESTFYINSIGYMKLSPDGTKLALVLKRAMIVDIFDFDSETGIISNPVSLALDNSPYGLEFSPDLTKLYVTDNINLFQFDIQSNDSTAIQNSMSLIHADTNFMGALQAAQDGRIYVAVDEKTHLGIIQHPNEAPENCNYTPEGIYLDGRLSRMGLPNFIQSWFLPQPIRVQPGCVNDTTYFQMQNLTVSDSVLWDFNDPYSLDNNSKDVNTQHVYTQAGAYTVQLTNWFGGIGESYQYLFYIEELPYIELGADTTLCGQSDYLLDAYSPHYRYLWQDNSTDSVLLAAHTGAYFVEVTDMYSGCKNSDTVNLRFADIPEINLGADTSFCENSSFKLSAYHQNYSYLWQDNSTDSIYLATNQGIYFVQITDENNCQNSDTVVLSHDFLPRFELGADTIICENNTLSLSIDLPPDETVISWYSEQLTDTIYSFDYDFYETDTVRVQAKNKCGIWRDTLAVTFKYCGDIIIRNVFTPDGNGQNDYFYIKGISEQIWTLVIYNRWGNEVYQSSDYQNDWRAESLNAGVYYYLLLCPETKQEFNGFVHVYK